MITRTGFCLLAAALTTGCVSSSGSGSTSTTGAGTTSSVGAGGSSTTGSVGAGGTDTTTTAGTGGGESCGGVQLGPATFQLKINGDPVHTEPIPYFAELTVEGKVLASAPWTVVIDTCPPSGSCGVVPAMLTVTAPDLPSVLVPPGAWVRLRARADVTAGPFTPGTSTLSLIENLPDWMGSPNLISTTSRVWFASFEEHGPGLAVPPSYLPYKVAEIPCDLLMAENESWRVTFPGLPSVDVPTGAQQAFDVTGPLAAHYVFHSLNGNHGWESNGAASYWLIGM